MSADELIGAPHARVTQDRLVRIIVLEYLAQVGDCAQRDRSIHGVIAFDRIDNPAGGRSRPCNIVNNESRVRAPRSRV